MELYEYQKELINSDEKVVVANWCRGAGLTTALAYYILEKKPQNVGFLSDKFSFKLFLQEFKDIMFNLKNKTSKER
ncbi:hypothetical protein [Bacillus smithii]|uniref:hypothetical protein n=1 Tax=Bacillus smithii TaxID=1479 RepID=UPI003D1C9DAA